MQANPTHLRVRRAERSVTASIAVVTWGDACRLEPALLALEADVRTGELVDEADFWPTWSRFKARLSRLVGWNAARPELRSSKTYELVLQRLLESYEERQLAGRPGR